VSSPVPSSIVCAAALHGLPRVSPSTICPHSAHPPPSLRLCHPPPQLLLAQERLVFHLLGSTGFSLILCLSADPNLSLTNAVEDTTVREPFPPRLLSSARASKPEARSKECQDKLSYCQTRCNTRCTLPVVLLVFEPFLFRGVGFREQPIHVS